MQTLERLRRRIENAEDMQSVVTTMKTLAAVNIRRYEAAVESLAGYNTTLRLAFRILFRKRTPAATREWNPDRFGAIVFGSDQGMCGQFNDEIASYTFDYMQEVTGEEADWSIVAVGARVESRLEDSGLQIEESVELPGSLSAITPLVQGLLPRIERWQAEREISRVLIFYNRRTSPASFQPWHIRLLPIDLHSILRSEQQERSFRTLPTFTMDWNRLFSALIRQYLFVTIFRACAESLAAENASRIASMQTAEENVEERLGEFHSQFNQMRQTSITEELLDVVSGFEALIEEEEL